MRSIAAPHEEPRLEVPPLVPELAEENSEAPCPRAASHGKSSERGLLHAGLQQQAAPVQGTRAGEGGVGGINLGRGKLIPLQVQVPAGSLQPIISAGWALISTMTFLLQQ